jgi:hypothetical protein
MLHLDAPIDCTDRRTPSMALANYLRRRGATYSVRVPVPRDLWERAGERLGNPARAAERSQCICKLDRKNGKKRRRHLRSEFLEDAHRPWDVPVAEMDHREIESGQAPLRHDLDEPPVTQ